ncbi:hypothetical protein RCO27_04475 [Sphingosinicella sp. LHD-64]|uniref:hypothetical protein n=1 Tax=Sphingosinicella sp. LHD-64 TaxID=3072139 RepID=UPI00280F340D|nr:hypothetical protein [Sphingosinicella sp. LHD-64]MDQ8755477.1 hypothetical protein [Sphingosinicella sp. LHD-64]
MGKSLKSRLKAASLALIAALGLAGVAPAAAQVLLYDPNFPTAPIEPSDPMVGIPLPGATPAEYRAHLVWNLRSGLNVAALQCQFSPYLRTVDNYNGILGHHARELAAAYTALEGYFRRVHGRTGPRRFDDYSTQTYNNFSTLQAQLGFCQTAAKIGRELLAARQGEFYTVGVNRVRALRSSLTPVQDAYTFTRMPIALAPVNLAWNCSSIQDRRERRQCERDQREAQRAERRR